MAEVNGALGPRLHSICTASKHFDDTSKVARVNYAGNSDAEVLRVWLQGSRLHSRGLLDDDGGGAFSTEGFGTKPGHAFVWLKDGTLVSHVHRAGEFHHSSFGGGKKVRCAGTWIVKNGLITMMDNNSGHYQPSDGHFLTLLQFFEKAGATDASTKVGTHSTVKGFGARCAQADYIKVADYYQKVQGRATFRYDNANLTRGD